MTTVPTQQTADSTMSETTYWRSLGELENTPEFQEALQREFPEGITEAPDAVSRRGFLSAVAASVALAGLTSCRKPVTKILPFNKSPEGYKAGLPSFYATTLTRNGFGIGVVVKSSDGRPTKIEGNAAHPGSLGGSDLQLQAELLQLYDPNRSRHPFSAAMREEAAKKHAADGHAHGAHGDHGHGPTKADDDKVWTAFRGWLESEQWKKLVNAQGEGLHVLLPLTSSPSLQGKIAGMKAGAMAKAKFHFWNALHLDNELEGAQMAFGEPVATHHDFSKAEVVLSLDSDFLASDGNNLVSARQWADTRREPDAKTLEASGRKLSRLYVVESSYTTTGTAADHRFRTKSGEIPAVAFALAKALGVTGADLGDALASYGSAGFTTKAGKNWLDAVAKDLQSARGRCLVVAGPRQPAAVHAVVHAINAALENVGKTVSYSAVAEGRGTLAKKSIQDLATAIETKACTLLLCLGTNPVYDAPADLKFGDKLKAAKGSLVTIHLGLHEDETAAFADWHFPLAHELETWGDARAHDGTVSLQQPLVAPLHGGTSALEFLGLLNGDIQEGDEDLFFVNHDTTFGYSLVQSHWQGVAGASFEAWWTKTLHDGIAPANTPNNKLAAKTPALAFGAITAGVKGWTDARKTAPTGTEVVLRGCAKMGDGRYANNSWMQEIPEPLSKLSWDNAAHVSMKTARDLNVENGDLLTIGEGAQQMQIPAWIVPGHADDSITIHLGWGRKLPHCKVANEHGFDAYPLRTLNAQWLVAGAKVARGQGKHQLVCTQEHGTMVGRALVRETTVAGNKKDSRWAPKQSPLDQAAALKTGTDGKPQKEENLAKSLWTERYEPTRNDSEVKRSPYQWGMVIDLNACTGCSACVVACVAENNIPMVGKVQVSRNREMFWIRADRYFTSPADTKKKSERTHEDKLNHVEDPQVHNMPVPCMQCENAPCESVCPVAATVHSPDGLNDMVYNRCIGTRYCSNNCPYKVRRYNYLDYIGNVPDTKRMAFNPDVTVRSRGVMEKCTYCVQRINGARIQAKLTNKKVGEGKDDVQLTTACAQACPTQAITFGNLLDLNSGVAKLAKLDLNYGLLSELNTKPRTTYLGRVRNPNPELLEAKA